MSKAQKGSWIVRMERTVITDVVVRGCTEEEARSDPWEYADIEADELEIDQRDWVVLSVTSN
jgi:hypothetical protein